MIGRRSSVMVAGLAAALLGACSGGDPATTQSWAKGQVRIDGTDYDVRAVAMEVEFGEDGYYSISGDPSPGQDADCVPGLSSGMSLYGSVPPSARSADDLEGKRLTVEFSGDGDDANLCFPGMNGLAGAEEAWVTIDSVAGDRVDFTMSGRFALYDEEGDPSFLLASARGTARLEEVR
jgi:hypothetical protein